MPYLALHGSLIRFILPKLFQWNIGFNVRPADLPDFIRPPVTEVGLSIQFGSLSDFRSAQVGLFWNNIRSKYPRVSEQPPLVPVFETFGGAPSSPQMVRIEAFLSPPMPRYWFEDEQGEHLLQVQQDRVLHNWRKLEASHEYPRYEDVRSRLSTELGELEKFLEREKFGEIRPNQCEVTYINMIQLPDGSNPHSNLHRITPLWGGEPNHLLPGEAEEVAAQVRYVLNDDGKPYGRVYVTYSSVRLVSDFSPVVQLEITARGKPDDETVEKAFTMLDNLRDVVVRTFAAVTTEEMHRFWERKNVG